MKEEILRQGFGEDDPEIVSDALSYLLHLAMWPAKPGDPGGTTRDYRTPVELDELTILIFEHPN